MKSPHEDNLPNVFIILLISLILPLFLIPVEKAIPYPFVVEEFAKAVLIVLLINNFKHKSGIYVASLVGVLFALSENIFYSTNFISSGVITSFLYRVFITTCLHVITALIIYIPAKKKLMWAVPSTTLAMLIHYLYNELMMMLI